jgi:hypothetical protein
MQLLSVPIKIFCPLQKAKGSLCSILDESPMNAALREN